jgi:outer membrane receptor for ferrienterochelin and colicins
MSRSATRTSVALLLATVATAHAQPVVDTDDLPPLPAAVDEAPSTVSRFAASEASEDVVVGAAKREQSLGNVASAVTVISADRIRRFGYRTIGEAVAAVAGTYLVDTRLNYAIGIRGLQIPGDFNTRVLVLVDGASVNEVWGAFAGVGFDAIVSIDEVSRIEVIRGPVSSVYGTNAFFGIINIVTRGAADSPRLWGRTGVHGIQGTVAAAGFAVGGLDRQLRGAVSVMDRFGESVLALPDGGDSQRDADGSRAFTAGVVGSYDGTFGQIRASKFNRQSPFAPYDVFTGLGGTPYDQVNRHLLVEGGHTHAITKRLTLGGRAYTNLYKFTDAAPPADPTLEATLETTGTSQTFGGELRGRYEIAGPLAVTAGTELSHNRTRTTAFESISPDTLIADTPKKFTLAGLYTELDGQPLPWLGFTGGLRADIHSQLQDNLSPRAALFLSKPDRYGAKLLYAEGFRNPSGFEAFFEDGSDFKADPDALRAETIRSFEAVAWAKSSGLATRVSAFYWDARDIIEARDAPDDPGLQQHQNTTRLVSRGVELEASYRNSQGWYGFAGGAIAQVGTDTMGELVFGDVTNAPLITAGAGVSTPKLGNLAHVSLEGTVIGNRPTRPAVDGTPSPESPTWLGLNLTVYAPNIRGFDVTAGARNLRGKRDQLPAPPDYDRSDPATVIPRVPGEGREIYVKVGYSY